ncbi:hypothetical protein A8C56_05340 [Niabella ginsenosidivorans]|uniref:Arm DNA-binding domain-containing protein n=1 Tax=Niabella ginsenosidivorans TaxID=1176587 RepID=A0A1A9I193_9BACT|nr:hypothetical protein A8C56_05340 [Niabella ginsenosidivorans]
MLLFFNRRKTNPVIVITFTQSGKNEPRHFITILLLKSGMQLRPVGWFQSDEQEHSGVILPL